MSRSFVQCNRVKARSAFKKPIHDRTDPKPPALLTVHIGPSKMDRAAKILVAARTKKREFFRGARSKSKERRFEAGCLATELGTSAKPTKKMRAYLWRALHIPNEDISRMTMAEAAELIEIDLQNEKKSHEEGKARL